MNVLCIYDINCPMVLIAFSMYINTQHSQERWGIDRSHASHIHNGESKYSFAGSSLYSARAILTRKCTEYAQQLTWFCARYPCGGNEYYLVTRRCKRQRAALHQRDRCSGATRLRNTRPIGCRQGHASILHLPRSDGEHGNGDEE